MKAPSLPHLWPHCLLALGLLCFISCVNHIAGEDDEPLPDDLLPRQSLCIQTRGAGEAQLEYPLHIYAFKADGTCAGSQIIASEADKLNLSLPKGSYRLVALAGTEGYNLPEPMTLTGTITPKSGQFATSALMMGNADITLESSNQTTNITLSYMVARMSLTLTQVPAEVTRASISLSPLSNTLSMDGKPGTDASVLTTSCTRGSNGNWTAPNLYTFGGNGQNTVCSISLGSANGGKTYGYTYAKALQAGTPYVMQGNFEGGTFAVSGNLVADGWEETENVAFGFGSGSGDSTGSGSGDGGSGSEGDGGSDGGTGGSGTGGSGSGSGDGTGGSGGNETVAVAAIPPAGSLWNGHLIALVTNQNASNTEADLLLLSLKEWKNVPAANCAKGGSNNAAALIAAYSEAGMTGWRFLTGAEATSLKKTYGSPLSASCLDGLNSLLTSAAGDRLTYSGNDDNGDEVRYLCTDGTQSFTFGKPTGANTTTDGSVRTYYLRAVRAQRVVVTGK